MIVWVLIALGINADPQSINVNTATEVFATAEKCLEARDLNITEAKKENKYKGVSIECFKREVIK